MNAQPTGHANIGAKVTVSPHFYHVAQGVAPEQTYSLTEAENVVYIDDLQALHAGVKALQGAFSLPFDGWLVNKGKRVSIESATVAGDFQALLKSIIYVEPDAKSLLAVFVPMYGWRGYRLRVSSAPTAKGNQSMNLKARV